MQLIGNFFNSKLIKVKNHVNTKHDIFQNTKDLESIVFTILVLKVVQKI